MGFKPVSQTYPYVKWLLYGHGGSGKTRLAAGAPKPVWLDSENSTETLRSMGPPFSEIPTKKMRDYHDPDLIIKDVERLIKSPLCDTIVLDSATTQLYSFMGAYVRYEYSKPRSKRTDPYKRFEADWGHATDVFTDLFVMLADAPIHVILIGHERIYRSEEPEDKGKITEIVPDVTPRLRDAVTRLVNVVSYLQSIPNPTGPARRRLYLNPTSIIESKNRYDIQETCIENPSWDNIFGKVLSNHG